MRRVLIALSLVTALIATGGTVSVAADDSQPNIAHPTVDPYGASYATWAQRWAQWAFGTPVATNPLVRPACATSQVDRIWYMPHTFIGNSAKLHCSIAERTPILLSAGGAFCDSSDAELSSSARLRACAEQEFDGLTNFRVWVDGVRVEDLDQYLITTPAFRLRYPPDNLFGVRPGAYRAVFVGYFLMLRPLPAGRHTVIVHDEFEGDVARVTAFLNVVARR